MRNVITSDEELPTTLADTISNSTKKGMRKMADSGQSNFSKGMQAARDLQDTRAVQYVQNNPAKTAGLVIAGGLVVYSLYSIFMNKR